jgi:hypothetical protein
VYICTLLGFAISASAVAGPSESDITTLPSFAKCLSRILPQPSWPSWSIATTSNESADCAETAGPRRLRSSWSHGAWHPAISLVRTSHVRSSVPRLGALRENTPCPRLRFRTGHSRDTQSQKRHDFSENRRNHRPLDFDTTQVIVLSCFRDPNHPRFGACLRTLPACASTFARPDCTPYQVPLKRSASHPCPSLSHPWLSIPAQPTSGHSSDTQLKTTLDFSEHSPCQCPLDFASPAQRQSTSDAPWNQFSTSGVQPIPVYCLCTALENQARSLRI